jgi:hypothetical protein
LHGDFWTKELLGYYMDTKPSKILIEGIRNHVNGLYKMDMSTSHDSLYLLEGTSTLNLWHQTMGHLHFQGFHTLPIDGMPNGMPMIPSTTQILTHPQAP